jgi:hypothetical protein
MRDSRQASCFVVQIGDSDFAGFHVFAGVQSGWFKVDRAASFLYGIALSVRRNPAGIIENTSTGRAAWLRRKPKSDHGREARRPDCAFGGVEKIVGNIIHYIILITWYSTSTHRLSWCFAFWTLELPETRQA